MVLIPYETYILSATIPPREKSTNGSSTSSLVVERANPQEKGSKNHFYS